MKVMVSACLLGENCKYNGGNNYSEKLEKYLKEYEVVSVCPEVMGGLDTPRRPAEIVDGIIMNDAGEIVDKEFRKGAEIALKKAIDEKIDVAILQSRSPSCGVKEIYDGSFSGKLIPGQGVFAKLLSDNGIKVIDIKDI